MKFDIFFAIFLSILSATFIWANLNLRYLSDWWNDNYFLNIMILSPVIGSITYFYWGIAVDIFGSLWSARFVAFSVSTIVFTALTWSVLGEDPLNLKTLSCLTLSFLILLIQLLL